jgi:inosine/xanthosine triphosphatase
MKICRIAVGSTRKPKLEAVHAAIADITPLLGDNIAIEIQGYEVESGVSHTPTSREELMRGARHRSETLKHQLASTNTAADFFIGLEGGLDVITENNSRRVFLESWAYVTDGTSGHFGCSGAIELPTPLVNEVLSRGTELSVAIDQFAGQVGIRDGQGAWGVLSSNLISRQDSFRLALVAAFAPFYNSKMYRASTAAHG